MKICHVITRMIVGGAQENTLFTVQGHLENGHDAVLVTGPSPGAEGKLLQQRQLPRLRVELAPHLVRQLSPWHDSQAYRSLRELFRREKFDVVHTHSSKAGILGRLAAAKERVPVVVHTIHGQAFHPYQAAWRNRLYIAAERLAARRSHRIYAVAEAMIKQCLEAEVAAPELYQTVYSGMDLAPYLTGQRDPQLARALGLPDGVPVVGKIARLFELKGYDLLLKAAPTILAEVPETRFLIVGDGPLRQSLESEIARLGIADKVIFTGLVPPDEVHRYTHLMDVLVHLSWREGLPRTVVQALASGKPAIGFDLDGTPEVIKDGETGHICAPGDHAAVAAAAVRLLRHPQLAQQLGAAGREFVRERWDWRHMVEILEQDYRRLLARTE